jgi:hypothetical protein
MPIVNLREHYELPVSPLTKIWMTVKEHLMLHNTDLSRFVKTWQMADGDHLGDVNPEDWTPNMFPVFRLELDEAGEGMWYNEVTQRTLVAFNFMLGLANTNHGRALDFFHAVIERMYPGDLVLYHKLKTYGVMSYTVKASGIRRTRFSGDLLGQIVQGRIDFNFEFRTKY